MFTTERLVTSHVFCYGKVVTEIYIQLTQGGNSRLVTQTQRNKQKSLYYKLKD